MKKASKRSRLNQKMLKENIEGLNDKYGSLKSNILTKNKKSWLKSTRELAYVQIDLIDSEFMVAIEEPWDYLW